MKAIVTAVHDDGAKWGWPGESVFRYRAEDGTWAWIPQLPKRRAVGDVFEIDDGWEWLDEDDREAKIAAVKSRGSKERRVLLTQTAEREDSLSKPKTGAQLTREIAEVLGVRRRRKT